MAAPTRRRAIRRHERRAEAINEFFGHFNIPELVVERLEERENENNNIQGEDVQAEQSQADVLKQLEVCA